MTNSGPSGLLAPFIALFRVMTAAGGLLRSEAALAGAEAKQAATDVARGFVMILVAAVLALIALNMLAEAAVHGLIAAGLRPWAAWGVAGLVVLIVAGILAMVGKRSLSASKTMSRHVGERVNSNLALLRREMEHRDV